MPAEDVQRNWFVRMAEYDRPWVGRVALALVLPFCALVTLVAFAAGFGTGVAVVTLGGVLISGEVWIARYGDRHAGLVFTWHSAWNLAAGAVLLVMALAASDRWAALIFGFFGAWLIVWRLALATLWIRLARKPDG